ncbi:uncharacterized protein BDZ99DRAFT_453245 [Mytilinidion resinicola]|uniref:F-box domain-containing protein n=1 Tax=Mytilinidion resinicola TaxID=574789 RepID=A0A6A6Y4J3_9PEZI|nr:uncharacterized protein BDZ99DRAFT_453245 [Mytilinidion resinicola]KAF2803549.1 hypothetical protein BDZ99DRAFT_453245 [Mytilinidion resinicola]
MPAEIVELIAGHLGLSDLRSLRFACRDVNAKVTASSRFEGFCVHKNVELRKSNVEELGARLCEPGVQKYLEHLTITGVLIVTKGLERIIREKTKPANLEDPCGMRRDMIGNRSNPQRVAASQSEVIDAESQLSDFKRQIHTVDIERTAGHDSSALADLFQIIKTHCKAAGLKSLTLDLVVRREQTTFLSPAVGAPFRQVWETAQHVLSVSLQAWHRSAIRIERLDVFSETEACGVQACTFAALQNQIDFKNLYGLRALSLSISNRMLPLSASEQIRDADTDEERPDERPSIMRENGHPYANAQQTHVALREERMRLLNDPDNITGLADWLRRTTSLEELFIRNYWVLNSFDTSAPALAGRKALVGYLAESVPLPNLRNLILRSADIEIGALLTLLRNSPRLKSLAMREVTLTASNGQSWRTVFAHITSHGAELTHVYFDNLFEETEQQHSYVTCFTPGTEPGYSISSGEDGSARLRRLGLVQWDFCRPSANGWNAFELHRREDVLRGIEYQLNPQYIVGSVQNSMWMEQRRRNHGPLG